MPTFYLIYRCVSVDIHEEALPTSESTPPLWFGVLEMDELWHHCQQLLSLAVTILASPCCHPALLGSSADSHKERTFMRACMERTFVRAYMRVQICVRT